MNLQQLIKLITPQTLLVLDIDSTLVQTHKRNESILRRFAHESVEDSTQDSAMDSAHPMRRLFEQAECFPFEYGYAQALRRLGLLEDDELQQEFGRDGFALKDSAKKDLVQQVAQFWRKNFFSNDYLHCDLPHDGAQDFVAWLNQKWIPHVYLTGRPRPLMWEGTLRAMQALQFPVTAENLYLKPQVKDVDEIFKTEKMSELKKGFTNVIFIDNEPRVLNQVDKDHPEIQLVFVDTCHSPNVFPPSSALKIKDFRELVQMLKA